MYMPSLWSDCAIIIVLCKTNRGHAMRSVHRMFMYNIAMSVYYYPVRPSRSV